MIWAALAGLTVLRLLVTAVVPLAPDEAYYWVWSHALAPGYLDHPPMVALWIRAGTAIAGEGTLGIRLLAPLSAAAGSMLLAGAARDLIGPRTGAITAALLNATLLFGVGAVTMTPDTPLLFFWTLALWALARLHRTGNGCWWLAAGLAIGLAMTSKYTAILLAAGVVLWVLALPEPRRWLWRWHPWAGGVLAVLIFSPTLVWNATHGWASFAKQGGRNLVWDAGGALRHLGELIGGQVGLATPLVFLLCVAGVVAAGRAWRDPAAGLLAALTVLPVLVFVEHALGDRVQANWPAIVYPSGAIAAAGLGGAWLRLRRPALVLGFAVTALVYLQGATAVIPLPPRLDPTARLRGWPAFAEAVAQAAGRDGARFIACDNYGDAALLARLTGLPVVGVETRWRLFALPDAHDLIDGQPGLLVRSAHRGDPPDNTDWASVTRIGEVARGRAESFDLYHVTGRPGAMPAVRLPAGTGAS